MFPRRHLVSSFIPFVLFLDSSNGIVFGRTAFPFLPDGIIRQAKACDGKDVEGVMMVRLCECSIHAGIYTVFPPCVIGSGEGGAEKLVCDPFIEMRQL